MSETAHLSEYQHMTCDECNKTVRVRQDTQNGLKIECDCESRSIKVKRAIPFRWSQ